MEATKTLYDSQAYSTKLFHSKYLEKEFFDRVQKYLHVKPGEKVLEVGCNQGSFVKRMQDIGADAVGVDINSQAIQQGVTSPLFVMDATKLDFPDESFDKIYSLHTIEHIENVQQAFAEMARVLKPGGKIVLIYPMEPGPLRGLFCLYSAIAVYKNPFSARKIHLHSINPRKIKSFIKGMGLEHQESHIPVLLYPQYLTVLRKR